MKTKFTTHKKQLSALVCATLLGFPWGGANAITARNNIQAGVVGTVEGVISAKENISGKYGIYALGTKASAIAENITISSDESSALGAYGGGVINVGGDSTKSVIITSTSYGIDALDHLEDNVEKGPAFVSVKASESVSIVSGTVALWAQNGTQSTQAPESHSSITVEAPTISIEGKEGAIFAYSNSEINVTGNATIKGGSALIEARGNASVNINRDNSNATTVLEGDIVFATPNVEGGNSNSSGQLINAFVNINLSGEGSSWTGRSYQSYRVDAPNGTVTVVTSEIGKNPDYFGQVSGFVLSVAKGAKWETTGDSFANVLNMDSGNLSLAADSVLHTNDFIVAGDSNTINFGNGANINGTIEDQGTLYMTGDVSSFTGVLNVMGKASVGLTAEEASETLNPMQGSVLVVKAGTTLNGSTSVGSSASATSNGSSLSVLSDGTLAIVATDDYTEGTPLVTVGTASTEDGSTVKLVNAVKIADGTTVFATSDGSAPSEYSLVTDNLLKVVENNQIVSQSASTALGGNVLTPNVINEALTASGLGAERVVALTTDTTAAQAVSALNNIALMGTASGAQTAAINAANIQLDVIDSHGSVLAGYAHEKSGADLWIDLNGSFSKANRFSAGSTTYGYKSDLAGVTIGSDYAFGNGYATGVSVSFGTGSVRGQGNGAGIKNEVDYYGVNLYGVWSNEYFNMIGSVGYLQTKNEIKSQGYKGKPDVKVVSAGVRLEKPLLLNESITVTPHVGVRYKHINMDSFNAGGFNYDSEKANLVEVPFGVAFNANLKAPCGAEVKPFIDLTIAPNFGDRKVTNKVALTDSSASDSFEARIANNSMYNAKLGLNAVKGNHSLGISYGIGSGSYGRVDQALQAKYRYSF